MNDSQSIKFRSCNRERGVAWNIPRCKLGSCYFSSITWPLPLPTLPSSWVYLSFLTISEASQRQIGISRLSSLFSCPPQHRPRYNYILLFAPQKLPSFGLSDTPISAKFQSICILVSDNCSVFVLFLADRACRLCKSHFVTQPRSGFHSPWSLDWSIIITTSMEIHLIRGTRGASNPVSNLVLGLW